jgi:hypothetical protein
MVTLLTNIFFGLVECLLSHQLNTEKTALLNQGMNANCASHLKVSLGLGFKNPTKEDSYLKSAMPKKLLIQLLLYPPVRRCGSHHTIKNGSTHNGKPKRQCKECGQPFVIDPTNKTISPDTKQLIDQLLLERISLRGIARVIGVSCSWLQNYVNNKLASISCQIRVSAKPKGELVIECDEMWSFVFSKTIKVYIWLAIDRTTREILGYYLGDIALRARQQAMGNRQQ